MGFRVLSTLMKRDLLTLDKESAGFPPGPEVVSAFLPTIEIDATSKMNQNQGKTNQRNTGKTSVDRSTKATLTLTIPGYN